MPPLAPGATSPADAKELLSEYRAAERHYQEAVKVYRALRRAVRSDAVLEEMLYGSRRTQTGLRLGTVSEGEQGVRVRAVIPGSLVEQAGLRADDVVVAIGGERLDRLSGARAVQTMIRAISNTEAGASVRIEYLRGGELYVTDTRMQTVAEIDELRSTMVMQRRDVLSPAESRTVRKGSFADEEGAVGYWSGLTFVSMTPALGQYFGAETGVLIVQNDEDLPLMGGDVILEVGRQAPADASQAAKLLQGYEVEEAVALLIWRHGRSFLVEFELSTSTRSTH